MVASPLFYLIATVALSQRPEHANTTVGRWMTRDGESSIAISGRNTAKFRDFPGLGTGKGIVRWSDDGLAVGWPIKGYTEVTVTHWPSAEEPTLVANGVELVSEDEADRQ